MTTSRRTVIGWTGAAGAATALGACSGSDGTSGEETGEGVRVPVADVPESGGLVQDRVVVTQPEAGTYAAFDVRCPHQGCAVDEVTTEGIVCPCHGSRFDLTDGSVLAGPATEGLTRRSATVDGADVVVS